MKFSAAIISFALAAVAAAGNVVELNNNNFDDIILRSGQPALVEFYTTWCGPCRELAPVMEQLGDRAVGKGVLIGKVDAADGGIGRRLGVNGFPTFKYYDGKGGAPEHYHGRHDVESIMGFLAAHGHA